MNLGKIGIIIQARMGSTRLPGKVLMQIGHEPVLQIVINRLKKCQKVDTIIVATSWKDEEKPIADLTRELGVCSFRGSENNVLKRFYQAAEQYKLETIIRITADCPLIDYQIINKMLEIYGSYNSVRYFSNVRKRTFPRGYDTEIFSFEMLKKGYSNAVDTFDKEHVTPYIRQNFRCSDYLYKIDYSQYRLTLDTLEDFELISNIFALNNSETKLLFKDVLRILKDNPYLNKINRDVEQKECLR